MPTYEYHCDGCDHGFEQFQPITAKAIKECPKCKKRSVRRVITGGAGLIFKGAGFYQTDYRSKSYQESASKDKKEIKDKDKNKDKNKKDTPPSSGGTCGPSPCKTPDTCTPDKNKSHEK